MRGAEAVQRWCAGVECRAGTELQVQGCRSAEVQKCRCRGAAGAEWVQWFSRGGCTGDCAGAEVLQGFSRGGAEVQVQVQVQVQRFCRVLQRCRGAH